MDKNEPTLGLFVHPYFSGMQRKYGGEHGRLEHFMCTGIPRRRAVVPSDIKMRVSIFSEDSNQPLQIFEVNVWPALDADILDYCACPQARLILVEYDSDLESLNPFFMGEFAGRFHMHPAFYAYHFKQFGPWQGHQSAVASNNRMLSFERPFIDFENPPFGGLFTLTLQQCESRPETGANSDSSADPPQNPTIIAFGRAQLKDGLSLKSKTRKSLLLEIRNICCQSMVKSPLDVVVPVILCEARSHKASVEENRYSLVAPRKIWKDPYRGARTEIILNVHREKQYYCEKLCDDLERFLEHCKPELGVEDSILRVLLEELVRIDASHEKILSQAQVSLQQIMTERSLGEANKSIQAAESVRRYVMFAS